MYTMTLKHFTWTEPTTTTHPTYEDALTALHNDNAHDFGMADDEPTSELLVEKMVDAGWMVSIVEDTEVPA